MMFTFLRVLFVVALTFFALGGLLSVVALYPWVGVVVGLAAVSAFMAGTIDP